MAKTSQPTRAPNKALYLTDYARSAWDIGALSATLPALARAPRGDGDPYRGRRQTPADAAPGRCRP